MEHQKWVSRYREELKGIAILWVIFFHALIPLTGLLYHIQKIGYGGVDIFFFLTGYGLYYSLEKNGNIRAYWGRRMRRILPAYLPFIFCWILVMFPRYQLSTVQAIRSGMGNLLLLGYWFTVPKTFNWYIGGLTLFLLLAPLFHGLLSGSGKPAKTFFFLLCVSVGLGFCCVGLDQYMAISRLPVFLLGMAFAMPLRPFQVSPGVKRGLYMLSFGVGIFILLLCFARYPELLLTYAMYWHPFALITPPLCIGLAYLFHKGEKIRGIFLPLRLFGEASFEIYLFNIWMVEMGKRYAVSGSWQWLLLSTGSIAVGMGYHFLVKKGLRIYSGFAGAN